MRQSLQASIREPVAPTLQETRGLNVERLYRIHPFLAHFNPVVSPCPKSDVWWLISQ